MRAAEGTAVRAITQGSRPGPLHSTAATNGYTYIKYKDKARFWFKQRRCPRGKNSRGAIRSSIKTAPNNASFLSRCREERRQPSRDECIRQECDRSCKFAPAPQLTSTAECEDGQQQSGNGDGDFAQCAPEEHDGEQQRDQEQHSDHTHRQAAAADVW